MHESALIGQPPANQIDYDIVKGLYAVLGIPEADPSKGIALPPPRPAEPSYENKGANVIGGLAVCIFVCLSITAGRVLARRLLRTSRLGWDDALIVVAALSATVWFALVIVMVPKAAVGQHIYNARYIDVWWFHRLGSVDVMLFFVAVSFTKLSIICFNARLTTGLSAAWKWVHGILFGLIVCYLLISLFWINFRCNPPLAIGDYVVAGRHASTLKCLPESRMALGLSALHVAFDWILLSIPVYVVVRSSIPMGRKVRAIVPLSVGTLSCVGSVMRLYYELRPIPDLTWSFPDQLRWTELDLTAAVIASSLPAINSILTQTLPAKIRAYMGGSSRDSNSDSPPPASKNRFLNGADLSVRGRREPDLEGWDPQGPDAVGSEIGDKQSTDKTVNVNIDMDDYPMKGSGATHLDRSSEETVTADHIDLENQIKTHDEFHKL